MTSEADDLNKDLLRDCEARIKRLNEWEQGFIKSIRKLLDAGKELTERQSVKLAAVWEKATEKG